MEKEMIFYKDRVIDEKTLVMVYFNLHKKVFSIKALNGEHKGKVVLHLPSLFIKEAEFFVNERGRLRVIREKCKNVHAGVRGYLNFDSILDVRDFTEQISYNPYKNETFVMKDGGQAVYSAPIAFLSGKSVWI